MRKENILRTKGFPYQSSLLSGRGVRLASGAQFRAEGSDA